MQHRDALRVCVGSSRYYTFATNRSEPAATVPYALGSLGAATGDSDLRLFDGRSAEGNLVAICDLARSGAGLVLLVWIPPQPLGTAAAGPARAQGASLKPWHDVKLSSCVTSFVTSVTGFVTPYRVEDEMLPKHSMANNQRSNNQSNETRDK